MYISKNQIFVIFFYVKYIIYSNGSRCSWTPGYLLLANGEKLLHNQDGFSFFTLNALLNKKNKIFYNSFNFIYSTVITWTNVCIKDMLQYAGHVGFIIYLYHLKKPKCMINA